MKPTDKDWRRRLAKLHPGDRFLRFDDWLIFPDTNNASQSVWTFQHEDAEPGDPRRGTGTSLLACIEAIEDFEDYNCCHQCKRYLAGDFHDDCVCEDCFTEAARDYAEMQEMADDDRAHAHRETAADRRAWAALTYGGPDA